MHLTWASTPGAPLLVVLNSINGAEDISGAIVVQSISPATALPSRADQIHPSDRRTVPIRSGVGRAIVAEIERLACERALAHLLLESSITAEPFYTALGYRVEHRGELALAPGLRMAAIRMRKPLEAV
jgi:hypothetical protein